jgi:hypothetical protein
MPSAKSTGLSGKCFDNLGDLEFSTTMTLCVAKQGLEAVIHVLLNMTME